MTRWLPQVFRYGLGAAGLAALAYGADTLVTDPEIAGRTGVLDWLLAALLLHDGVVAPAVVLLGAAVGARWRGRLRWPFVVAGSLVVVALPLLIRPGGTANPSVLPLDYARGLEISVAVVLALALCRGAARRAAGRRTSGRRGGRPQDDDRAHDASA